MSKPISRSEPSRTGHSRVLSPTVRVTTRAIVPTFVYHFAGGRGAGIIQGGEYSKGGAGTQTRGEESVVRGQWSVVSGQASFPFGKTEMAEPAAITTEQGVASWRNA